MRLHARPRTHLLLQPWPMCAKLRDTVRGAVHRPLRARSLCRTSLWRSLLRMLRALRPLLRSLLPLLLLLLLLLLLRGRLWPRIRALCCASIACSCLRPRSACVGLAACS